MVVADGSNDDVKNGFVPTDDEDAGDGLGGWFEIGVVDFEADFFEFFSRGADKGVLGGCEGETKMALLAEV
jgi:hypothetical protein